MSLKNYVQGQLRWWFHLVIGMWDGQLQGLIVKRELAVPGTSKPDLATEVGCLGWWWGFLVERRSGAITGVVVLQRYIVLWIASASTKERT
jgi:hypothetical protein